MKKMKIGFIGLGKLGFPVALAMSVGSNSTDGGHDIMGYDIKPELMSNDDRDYIEAGPDSCGEMNGWAEEYPLKFGTMKEVANHAEIIFVAVQTPHEEEFEGITRLGTHRRDFNYSYLETAIWELSKVVKKNTVIAVISTVLPGTFRELLGLANKHMKMVYNPSFVGMGTVMYDFLNPEFVLIGIGYKESRDKLYNFYRSFVLVSTGDMVSTTLENAELIKVAYNTFIGMKITYANALMEMCHKLPNCNIDIVTGTLKKADKRLISDAYMDGGMGNGGGCHPRDNIALSWLAKKLDLSSDIFEKQIITREHQTEWLVDLILENRKENMPVVICGEAFKENTNLTEGSPSKLLVEILKEHDINPIIYDPIVYGETALPAVPSVFFIATKHNIFKKFNLAVSGSVVIDPWRFVEVTEWGVKYIPIGHGPISILKDKYNDKLTEKK